MKKLCTYLTLFVLGLLALAQPAAAADVTFYFENTDGWEQPSIYWWNVTGISNPPNPQAMSKVPGTDNVYYKTLSNASVAGNTGIIFTSKAGTWDGIQRKDFNSGVVANRLYSPSGMSSSDYTPPVVQPTDYTFYVDASSTGWPNVYLRLWNGNSTWNASGTRYLEPTETLSNGVKKFVVEGVTQVGQMMFRSVNSDVNWDAGNESKDISTPVNGTLYTLTKDTNDRNKWNFKTKPDYQEPAVKPVVTANPPSCTFYGSQSVTLSADKKGAKIYYTTNGTEPSAINGTEYSTPLSFTETTTLKAVAILDGVSSEVLTATYTKGTPEVLIQPSSTTFETTLEVTITATPASSKIYYTTNGDVPTASLTAHNSPVTLTIDANTTVKAIAVNGTKTCDMVEATFTKEEVIANFVAGTSKVWISIDNGTASEMPWNGKIYSYPVGAKKHMTIWWGETSDKDVGDHRIGVNNNGTTFTADVQIVTFGNQYTNSNYVATGGTLYFDGAKMQAFLVPENTVYIMGPAANGPWTPTPMTSVGNGEYTYAINAAGFFGVSLIGIDDAHANLARYGYSATAISKTQTPITLNSGNLDISAPAAAVGGTLHVNTTTNRIWYTGGTTEIYTGELHIKGPGYANNWDSNNVTGKLVNGVFSFPVASVAGEGQNGQFCISSNQNDYEGDEPNRVYYIFHAVGQSGLYDIPQGEANAVSIEHPTSHSDADNLLIPAAADGGTVYINMNEMKIWYEPATAKIYIRGAFTGTDTDWGKNEIKVMDYDDATHVYSYPVSKAGEFMISTASGDGFWTASFQSTGVGTLELPAAKPEAQNIQIGGVTDKNFNIPAVGTIYFSHEEWKIWYEPKPDVPPTDAPLYILGQWLGDSWGSNTPIAMDYEPSTGVFSYVVTAAADANSPLYFSISKGSATGKDNSDSFFNAANEFQYESHPYIRFSEPKKANAKNQHVDDHNFAIISAGTVKAKYDETDPTKLKVWYTPADGQWPALYIIGANISDNDKDGQWKTPVQMTPSTTQPGIYSYVLDELYCDLDYTPSGADGNGITQNEKGHFNISFFPNYSSGDQQEDLNAFWKNSFIPDGGGMGMLSRDGVPFPFGFREEDATRTNWTSTNFVFNEKCTIYVDAVRQLVWVKVKTELSSNQVVFDFWDKGGSKYTEAEGYRWWNNKDNYFAQAYLRDAEGNETGTYNLNFVATESQKSDLNSSGPEQILEDGNPNPVNVGQRYRFIASLPASYYQENGKVVEGKYIWIRIKKGASGSVSLERPYAYQATYTQGPKEDIEYNHYGNIKAAGDPIVTIEPSVNMIYADVEAPEHLGLFRESHVMHYPYVNQYSTAVTVNPGNVYPFWVEGLTEEAKDESGNVIADQYVPVAGAPFTFTKSNQVTVSYGSIRETKYGTTGMAVIKGIDHANAAATDKMEVTVTYTSPGLIFARTKTEPLKIDANELPTMQNSQDNQLDVAAFYSGTACNQGLTVDLILHQKFEFRDIMIQGGEADGKIYVPRAAYIGYEVKIDNPNDHSHVVEGQEHMAKNGVPLMWDFKDDNGTEVKAFEDPDKWHYEAFTGKSMAIQLHHVLCGKTKADLEGKTVTGSVTFHLYVPVATEFAFETGTTSLVRGMHKAGEQVNSSVLGDPNHPYTGSVSAKSYDTLKHNIDFSFGVGNITTGVEGVGVEDAPVEFYNLQGVRMTSDALAPGIYIRRQGNETSKVYIR